MADRIHSKYETIYRERERERETCRCKDKDSPLRSRHCVCVCTGKRFNTDIVTLRRLRSDNFADKGKRAFVNIFLRFLRDKRETRGNKIRALSFHKDRREITDFNTATIADTYGQLEN